MSSYKIHLIVGLLLFSITNAYGAGDEDSLYKILKIKTNGDHYVIHAKRNDSLFKIISQKVAVNNRTDLKKLKKGKLYYFDFGRDEDDTTKYGPPLTGLASPLHVKVKSRYFREGETKIKWRKRFHNKLYRTRNLVGLYYSRWPVKKS